MGAFDEGSKTIGQRASGAALVKVYIRFRILLTIDGYFKVFWIDIIAACFWKGVMHFSYMTRLRFFYYTKPFLVHQDSDQYNFSISSIILISVLAYSIH